VTLSEFAHVFAPLAIQLRQTDADEATIRFYFEAVKDLEIEFVVMAAARLAKESDWFPKTSEWRTMTATIERERADAQRALLRTLPSPLCAACDDTGWSRDAADRVSRCDCQQLRRLELLGRRPWPSVPEDRRLGAASDVVVDPAETAALMTTIERRTGLTIAPRAMPNTTPAADQLKAAKKVMAEIVASVHRCEALERQVPDSEEIPNG
jgi:hypothetical protein